MAATENSPDNPKPPKATRPRPEPSPAALAWPLRDFQRLGGPGRTKTYELAKAGKLNLVRVGGRTLVNGDSGRKLLREGC